MNFFQDLLAKKAKNIKPAPRAPPVQDTVAPSIETSTNNTAPKPHAVTMAPSSVGDSSVPAEALSTLNPDSTRESLSTTETNTPTAYQTTKSGTISALPKVTPRDQPTLSKQPSVTSNIRRAYAEVRRVQEHDGPPTDGKGKPALSIADQFAAIVSRGSRKSDTTTSVPVEGGGNDSGKAVVASSAAADPVVERRLFQSPILSQESEEEEDSPLFITTSNLVKNGQSANAQAGSSTAGPSNVRRARRVVRRQSLSPVLDNRGGVVLARDRDRDGAGGDGEGKDTHSPENGSSQRRRKRSIDSVVSASQRPIVPNIGLPSDTSAEPLVLDSKFSIEVPSVMTQYLRSYQRQGVSFLYSRYKQNKGGILADDMGLGKTVQVICFFAAILGKTGNLTDYDRRPSTRQREREGMKDDMQAYKVLLVLPKAVCRQWCEELERWGLFFVSEYAGETRLKEEALNDIMTGQSEILLVSYGMLTQAVIARKKKQSAPLLDIKWDVVICDEVHTLKNPASQISQGARALKCSRRFGLTGTPQSSRPDELHAIVEWACPRHLPPLGKFDKTIVRALEKGQDRDATGPEIRAKREAREVVHRLLKPVLLRRTKKHIADQLPKKTELVVYCDLQPLQIEVYERFLESKVCENLKSRGKISKYALWVDKEEVSYIRDGLPMLMLLQRVSNHLALLMPATGKPSQKHLDLFREVLPGRYDDILNQAPEFVGSQHCGKLQVLEKLLRVWTEAKSKILLFSSSVQMLNLLAEFIGKRLGIPFCRLDGSMSATQRTEAVNDFSRNPNMPLFLISIKAGGTGLNLQAANVVVIFEPNWEPQYDQQAQDRAFRLGQEKDVTVYRLIAKGTFEELIYTRQVHKEHMTNLTIHNKAQPRLFQGSIANLRERARHQGGNRDSDIYGLQNLFKFTPYRAEPLLKKYRERAEAAAAEGLLEPGITEAQYDQQLQILPAQWAHRVGLEDAAEDIEDAIETSPDDPMDLSGDTDSFPQPDVVWGDIFNDFIDPHEVDLETALNPQEYRKIRMGDSQDDIVTEDAHMAEEEEAPVGAVHTHRKHVNKWDREYERENALLRDKGIEPRQDNAVARIGGAASSKAAGSTAVIHRANLAKLAAYAARQDQSLYEFAVAIDLASDQQAQTIARDFARTT